MIKKRFLAFVTSVAMICSSMMVSSMPVLAAGNPDEEIEEAIQNDFSVSEDSTEDMTDEKESLDEVIEPDYTINVTETIELNKLVSGKFDSSKEATLNLSINNSSIYELNLSYPNVNGSMCFDVYDKYNERIFGTYNTDTVGSSSYTKYFAFLKGDYKIRFRENSGGNNGYYAIKVASTGSAENHQSYEEEYGASSHRNDTRAMAVSLLDIETDEDGAVRGILGRGNTEDWYKFTVPSNGSANFRIKGVNYEANTPYMSMMLYAENSSSPLKTMSIAKTFGGDSISTPGVYYIRVYSTYPQATSGSYELYISGRGSGGQPVTPNSYSVNLEAGKTHQINTSTFPSGVTYSSSNSSIATVSSTGLITALKKGSANIYAKDSSNQNVLVVNVTVEDIDVEYMPYSVKLEAGKTHQINTAALPSGVTYSSSNSSVATVSSTGLITAVKAGSATVYAKNSSGKNILEVNVTVEDVQIEYESYSMHLEAGATHQIDTASLPSGVTYTSDNTSVATVSSTGLVTAVKNGVASIDVKNSSGKSLFTVTVTVLGSKDAPIPDTKVTLDREIIGTFDASQEVSYEFSVDKSSVYKLSTTYDGTNYMEYSILDKYGKSIWSDQTAYNKTGVASGSSQYVLLKGDYTIKLNSIFAKAGDTYSLKVTSVYPSENYQSFEEEYGTSIDRNDTRSDATIINSDGKYNGLICPNNSDDWYKVTVGSTPVKVKMKQVKYNGTDARYFIYKGDSESSVLSGTIPSTYKEVAISEPGVHYIHIDSLFILSNSGNSYEMIISNIGKTEPVEPSTPDSYSIEFEAGDTHEIDTFALPSGVTYSSSNPSIATVSSTGLITAVKAGSATVYAKNSSGKDILVVRVTVKASAPESKPVKSILFTKDKLMLDVGDTSKLEYSIAPVDADNKDVVFTSSAPDVVSVTSYGYITAKSAGDAVIAVTTVDGGHKATCDVSVTDVLVVPVSGIRLGSEIVKLDIGQEQKLDVSVKPSNATNSEINYISNNPSIVSVTSDGIIKGVSSGSTEIKCISDDGNFENTVKVFVSEKENGIVSVKSIKLNRTGLELKPGSDTAFAATISPADATNKEIIWTSSNTSVIKVEGNPNGVVYVKAISSGTAVITATTEDGNHTARLNAVVSDGRSSLYKITYKLGVGSKADNSYNPLSYAKGMVFALEAPVQEGLEFKGWYKDSSYSQSASGIKASDTGNKTFVAKWKPIKYTISYDSNGGTKVTNNTTYDYTTATFKLKNPTKIGYKFVGWYDENGDKFTQITKGSYGNKNFVAYWSPIEYKINYKLGGGDVENAPETFAADETVVLPTPTREGYEFDGWKMGGKRVTSIAKGTKKNVTVTAVWKPVKYSLVYDSNGGSEVKNRATYTSSMSFKLRSPKRKGYKFIAWIDTEGETYKRIAKGTFGNKVLTAEWEPIEYKIRFKLNKGEVDDALDAYTIEDSVELPIPYRDGYTFKGWKSGGKYYDSIDAGTTGNKTFTAVWQRD